MSVSRASREDAFRPRGERRDAGAPARSRCEEDVRGIGGLVLPRSRLGCVPRRVGSPAELAILKSLHAPSVLDDRRALTRSSSRIVVALVGCQKKRETRTKSTADLFLASPLLSFTPSIGRGLVDRAPRTVKSRIARRLRTLQRGAASRASRSPTRHFAARVWESKPPSRARVVTGTRTVRASISNRSRRSAVLTPPLSHHGVIARIAPRARGGGVLRGASLRTSRPRSRRRRGRSEDDPERERTRRGAAHANPSVVPGPRWNRAARRAHPLGPGASARA